MQKLGLGHERQRPEPDLRSLGADKGKVDVGRDVLLAYPLVGAAPIGVPVVGLERATGPLRGVQHLRRVSVIDGDDEAPLERPRDLPHPRTDVQVYLALEPFRKRQVQVGYAIGESGG